MPDTFAKLVCAVANVIDDAKVKACQDTGRREVADERRETARDLCRRTGLKGTQEQTQREPLRLVARAPGPDEDERDAEEQGREDEPGAKAFQSNVGGRAGEGVRDDCKRQLRLRPPFVISRGVARAARVRVCHKGQSVTGQAHSVDAKSQSEDLGLTEHGQAHVPVGPAQPHVALGAKEARVADIGPICGISASNDDQTRMWLGGACNRHQDVPMYDMR